VIETGRETYGLWKARKTKVRLFAFSTNLGDRAGPQERRRVAVHMAEIRKFLDSHCIADNNIAGLWCNFNYFFEPTLSSFGEPSAIVTVGCRIDTAAIKDEQPVCNHSFICMDLFRGIEQLGDRTVCAAVLLSR
jgi:hypothetical protein